MTDANSIAQTILSLRAAKVEGLLQTEDGREIARLDRAYSALMGHAPPPWHQVADESSSASAAPTVEERGPQTKTNGSNTTRGPSMRHRVQTILEEAPQIWTYDTMVTELERRGHGVTGPDGDPKSSLRTAAWTLVRRGAAKRGTEDGVFWATKYDAQLRATRQVDAFGDPVGVDTDPHEAVFLHTEVPSS